MTTKDEIKLIEQTISTFNKANIWLFKGLDIKKHIKEKFDVDVDSNSINNCIKYLLKHGRIYRSNSSKRYFGYLESKYHSPINQIDDVIEKKFNISGSVVNLIEKLNSLGEEVHEKIFSKESLFTTMIEFSTLNEFNIRKRSLDIYDLEVIEKNNIESLYKLFLDNEIKQFIDVDFLKNIHSRLTSGIVGTNRMHGKGGEFTKEQNYISGGFLPCELEFKEEELIKYIRFFNKEPNDIEDAIVRVAILSYWFAGIHIFDDANSKTGRFLISYYMYLHGYSSNMSFAISKALYKIGGKEEFVGYQGRAWNEKDIKIYVEWFIEELLNNSWVNQTKKYI